MNYIICHYHEIGLKGKNRKVFEEVLVKNIKQVIPPEYLNYVKRISGRILIELTKQGEGQQKKIIKSLKNIFGIAYFAFAVLVKQDIKSIQNKACQLLKKERFKTFKTETKRANKNFPLTSQEINEKIGAKICNTLNKKVDLKNPEITCFIEIVEKFAFIYLKKHKGPGGLPVGSSGKGILLLSGGIDSPVAAFYALKRGISLDFIHFHAQPYTNKASMEKVIELIKVLKKFQPIVKLYLVPFGEAQQEILLKTPDKLRVILYRRLMVRIAERIAQKEKAKALITGDSIGQVASQTLENLGVVQKAVNLPIIKPLACLDKEEIIQKAKEIGTYEISILPHQDCCARFLPKHPETKADLEKVKKAEKKLNIKKLIEGALKNTKIEVLK